MKTYQDTKKIGDEWEAEALSIIKTYFPESIIIPPVLANPDIRIIYKGKTIKEVECKKFTHMTDMHKLSVDSFCHYSHRDNKDILYFYWNPNGKHEIFRFEEIVNLITNYKNPQRWVAKNRNNKAMPKYFYHFKRYTGIPCKAYFKVMHSDVTGEYECT